MPKDLLNAVSQTVQNFGKKGIQLHDLKPIQGKSCGALLAFKHLAKETGILDALGNNKAAKLALFQIIGRLVVQQSRLYIGNEWKETQAINEVLNLKHFNEDDLYLNLDWLCENQEKIEKKLFDFRHKNKAPITLFLYDVTSSYLEGKKNELANYGYNRDKKGGKLQIVIGLMCDEQGFPISVEVFEENTIDSKTVVNQIKKLAHRFRVKDVVFVGDRGMIKSVGIEKLNDLNWHYITAITKPQIHTLLNQGTIQMELFTKELIEVEEDGIRYILHKNICRTEEIQNNRKSKEQRITALLNDQNNYLKEHPKSKTEAALKRLNKKIARLKASNWLSVEIKERTLILIKNEEKLAEESLLDGCYIIKTEIEKKKLNTEVIHQKYKDLSMVEQAFRTCKTSIEQIRPIYVRKESRTRGHVFVCMLAYILVKEMEIRCEELNFTRKHIIDQLNQLQYIQFKEDKLDIKVLPYQLKPETEKILNCLGVTLPNYL